MQKFWEDDRFCPFLFVLAHFVRRNNCSELMEAIKDGRKLTEQEQAEALVLFGSLWEHLQQQITLTRDAAQTIETTIAEFMEKYHIAGLDANKLGWLVESQDGKITIRRTRN